MKVDARPATLYSIHCSHCGEPYMDPEYDVISYWTEAQLGRLRDYELDGWEVDCDPEHPLACPICARRGWCELCPSSVAVWQEAVEEDDAWWHLACIVAEAEHVAQKAHEGQLDKIGKPYIDHPRRVAEALPFGLGRAVGWLHDVIEDSFYTRGDLADRFPDVIVQAVDAMTRRDGEGLEDYLARVCANGLARAVKAADVADNTSPARMECLDEATRARLERKYQRTRELLAAA